MKLNWSQIKGPPRLSFKEMALEFDVSQQKLRNLMGDKKNPAPVFISRFFNAGGTTTYYNAVEMRKWWADRKKVAA